MKRFAFLPILLILALTVAGPSAAADTIPKPAFLADVDSGMDPVTIANAFLRIPYRPDGTLDDRGRFTLIAKPNALFRSPGFNCSGLVLSMARFLLNKNFVIEDITRDRLGDSGEDSALGQDWDYGWDLILNLTDGFDRRVILPEGVAPLAGANGETLRGFDLQDTDAWAEVLPRIRPGQVYFASLSKPSRRVGAHLLHHHVGIILADGEGGVWFYHATAKSRTHRLNLNTAPGLQRFRRQFENTGSGKKMILIVEVRPQAHAAVASQTR